VVFLYICQIVQIYKGGIAGIMAKEQFSELLALGTGASVEYDERETFIDAFKRQVENNPDATAVVDIKSFITYRELDRRSDTIAAELLEMGVKPGDFIAVKLPRVKEFIVAVIGIWKAGAAYLPIDPIYPEERIRYMLEDSEARMTIDESWLERLRIPSITSNPINFASADSAAILIYTSGSTGQPKGTVLVHSSVRAECNSMNYIYEYNHDDAVAEIASFSYVVSCSDLFPPLVYGLRMFILDHSLIADLQALDRYIRENGITVMTVVPQIGIPLIRDFRAPLRVIGMGGDCVEIAKQSAVRIVSGYGLTETCSAVSFVDLSGVEGQRGSLLGRPVPGVTMVLEDETGNPVQRGELGEVCIASSQVAEGYLHNKELTTEVFVDRPWSEHKVFRTGDIGRWNEQGVLEFHGRKDDIVKEINGEKILLGVTAFDVSELENRWLQSDGNREKASNYFDALLNGAVSMTYPYSTYHDENSGHNVISIKINETENVNQFCEREHLTPNNLFLSSLVCALKRLTNQDSFVIFSTSSGRGTHLQRTLGNLVKFTPVVAEEDLLNSLSLRRHKGFKINILKL